MKTAVAADPAPRKLLRVIALEQALELEKEWRNHIPNGYEDQSGYGQVSCSCGWDSGDKLGWEAHIDAAERIGRA